jgi:hypothetical protein
MSRNHSTVFPRLVIYMVFLASYWSGVFHPAHVRGEESPVIPGKSVDQWIELLGSEDDEASFRAVDALVTIGPSAVPRLAGVLGHENVFGCSRSAIRELERLGAQAHSALPALCKLADGADQIVRDEVRGAITSIEEQAKDEGLHR